jgi:transposase-like protein
MNTNTPFPCPSTPQFCPNPDCRFHHPQPDPWLFHKYGTYPRQKPPYSVQRYRCRHCGRCFADQTYKATYWLKCPEHLVEVQKHAVSGAANRQIARILRCSPTTVDNHLARLGRHCILVHRHFMQNVSPFGDIVLDGLLTFERSQYHPFEILTAIDRPTSFVIHFAEAERRRSGRMTAYQKKKRAKLEALYGKANPRAVRDAVTEVLGVALAGASKAQLWSDEHTTYPIAIKDLFWCQIDHRTISSKMRRTIRNPLFEVNLLDMLLRHCQKAHTRETIAFCRRRQDAMYRMAIMLVWRNYIKLRRERRCTATPAMMLGLTDRAYLEEELVCGRLFVTHDELPRLWDDYYWRRVKTRALAVNRVHELKYAF